ncbi:hypothetical protein [Thiobacillus sp.]|uniref:hypothetical protein n=1 Tax=Thiobacillus sp. TaxID=924 RepID=UPI00286E7EE2|nr:hypothetical protein [Thiobacillus sp.]
MTTTPMLLEDQKRALKEKRSELSEKLKKWKENLAKNKDNEEAKAKVATYEKLLLELKFRLRYSARPKKKPCSTRKWSPVLSGSFESGKRR